MNVRLRLYWRSKICDMTIKMFDFKVDRSVTQKLML